MYEIINQFLIFVDSFFLNNLVEYLLGLKYTHEEGGIHLLDILEWKVAY